MKILYTSLFILFFSTCIAQLTRVRGKITDSATGESLQFVNVAFKNTTIGTISDIDGQYHLETRSGVDTVMFSFLGYETAAFPIKQATFQEINIALKPSAFTLDEIAVLPGRNPALILLDSLHAHRPRNNPVRLESWNSEIYNKMEFDISNIDDDFKNRKVMRQFQFVFDYVDTSVMNGKNYLPVFLTETVSRYYFQKTPEKEKEIITASSISGVNNEQITQFVGQMYLKFNPYDNNLGLFGKNFVSPISTVGNIYYRYYLIDSAYINSKWCYHISYLPRRKQELTFSGDFWIHDTTYALCKINARMDPEANINFLNDLYVEAEYQFIDDSVWFIKQENVFCDFNISERTSGIFGHKTTSYRDIKIGERQDPSFFNSAVTQETIIEENAGAVKPDQWSELRHFDLTQKELQIFDMVDSIKHVPLFQTWLDIMETLINGHYVAGLFEIGPYYKLYSYNAIEGQRIRLGGRTSNEFSTDLMLTGHVAYGFRDQRFKFAQGGIYLFDKNPRHAIGWDVKHDIEQLGISQNAFTQDNILASLFSRTYNRKLTIVDEVQMFYEKGWIQGLSNTIILNTRRIWATEYIPFKSTTCCTTVEYDRIPSTEITLNTRYAHNEKFIMGEFERMDLRTTVFVFNLNATAGLKNVFGSNYEYYRIHASFEHKVRVYPFGRFKYTIDGGYYFGSAPYPLLQLHEGNETYAYDDYAFNMMNYYEFVSDKYISVFAEQHFEGFFLNHIPLLRKLKWREVVSVKALIGDISQKNRDIMEFPYGLSSLTVPYGEAGVGIENIFKVFRIEAMWRLSYLNKPELTNIPKFGIRGQLRFEF